MSYIGPKGYSIKKKLISVEEQRIIRKELDVAPFVPKSSPVRPKSFAVYRESTNKLYVQRFYGITKYGEPKSIKISDGMPIQVLFAGTLRPKQKIVVNKYLKHINNHENI